MKVDELLKRLENIKIDENKINEEREIAEYLAQMPGVNESPRIAHYYIMLRNREIYTIGSYKDWLKFGIGEILSDDAYVYAFVNDVDRPAYYHFPFLTNDYLLPYAYLSKLGFESYPVVPAIGLKYVATVIRYPDIKHIVVEVADIDIVTTNTNLPTLTRDILGTEEIGSCEVEHIVSQLESQKLFAGYDFNEARDIIYEYYKKHDTSLAKEVGAIKDAYSRIFKPYRVVYDLKTEKFITTYPRPPTESL
jgi:hypothetical protein